MSSDTATKEEVANNPSGQEVSTSMGQEPVLTDHSYDGIQEYDNPLPGWWKWLFIVTTIFAPLYVIYFHLGTERSIQDEYGRHMAKIFELRFEEIGMLEPDAKTIREYIMDPEKKDWLAVGEVVYKTNCVSCHGADGSGVVGPNLTDLHWKNVRKIEDIAKVIKEGAANGAMPAWGNRLSHQNQIVLTAAYIASLQENPKVGKAPDAEARELPAWKSEAQ